MTTTKALEAIALLLAEAEADIREARIGHGRSAAVGRVDGIAQAVHAFGYGERPLDVRLVSSGVVSDVGDRPGRTFDSSERAAWYEGVAAAIVDGLREIELAVGR